jgi:hypothetical protein
MCSPLSRRAVSKHPLTTCHPERSEGPMHFARATTALPGILTTDIRTYPPVTFSQAINSRLRRQLSVSANAVYANNANIPPTPCITSSWKSISPTDSWRSFADFQPVAEKHHPWWNRATGDLRIAVCPICNVSPNSLRNNAVKEIFTRRSTLALSLHHSRLRKHKHPPVADLSTPQASNRRVTTTMSTTATEPPLFELLNEVVDEGKNEISTSVELCVFGTG